MTDGHFAEQAPLAHFCGLMQTEKPDLVLKTCLMNHRSHMPNWIAISPLRANLIAHFVKVKRHFR